MFGYDPTMTWKVTEIRPSEVPGLAEVVVVITNPQGSNPNRLLVSSDGKHAISGDILPFGAKPFDDARAKLEKGAERPSQGAGQGSGNHCRVQRYAVSALSEGRAERSNSCWRRSRMRISFFRIFRCPIA